MPDLSGPYGQGVPVYVERGWDGITPILPGTKQPSMREVTGYDGRQIDAAESERLAGRMPWGKHNLALRMPEGMVGIDTDEHDDKHGADTIAAVEKICGPLPRGPYSSARGPGEHGIRPFHLPDGHRVLKGEVTAVIDGNTVSDVEIIQHHHRTMVVWPSTNPNAGNAPYRWYSGDDTPLEKPPRPEELPTLPRAWMDYLTEERRPEGPYVPPVDKETGEVLEGFQGTPEGLRRHVERKLQAIRDLPVNGPGETPVNKIAFGLSKFVPLQLDEKELRTALYAAVRTWVKGHDRGYDGIEHGLRHINTAQHRPRLWEERQGTRVTDLSGERPTLNLGNAAECAEWLRVNVGAGLLSGMFLRGGAVVFTPRQGEDGYREPDKEEDEDGPAQMRLVDASRIASTIQWTYTCVKTLITTGEKRAAMFPKSAAQVAVDCPEMIPNLRVLKGVTHTPLVRRDGSVLSTPGYDPATKLLYLPPADLDMPEVPENPTKEEVKGAVDLLMLMTSDFPYVHEDHRANFFGYLLTPLLRELLPPPYKAFFFNARQPGSGKTLQANLARIIHGGVFRGSTPEDEAEIRKQVSSILDQTTAPIVVFDNVTGLLKSATFAALLTSAAYSDRRLGVMEEVARRNDRVWSFTGNNGQVGGDLPRRTIMVDIDPGVPHPEERTGFTIDNIEGWTAAHRGELLRALLILVRSWVVNGMEFTQVGSDGFSRWVGAVRAILANAEIPGVFDSKGTRVEVGEGDDEWSDFLEAVERVRGNATWVVNDLLKDFVTIDRLTIDCLPADLATKVNNARGDFRAIAKSLGRWLRNREGRWARNVTVRSAGKTRDKVQMWHIERHGQATGQGTEGAGFAGFAGFENPQARVNFGPTSVVGEKKQSGEELAKPRKPCKPRTPGRRPVLPKKDS